MLVVVRESMEDVERMSAGVRHARSVARLYRVEFGMNRGVDPADESQAVSLIELFTGENRERSGVGRGGAEGECELPRQINECGSKAFVALAEKHAMRYGGFARTTAR